MAAVFALVFIPALAAIGFMVRAGGSLDLGTAMAMAVFIPLTLGVFYGTLRMAKEWDAETK